MQVRFALERQKFQRPHLLYKEIGLTWPSSERLPTVLRQRPGWPRLPRRGRNVAAVVLVLPPPSQLPWSKQRNAVAPPSYGSRPDEMPALGGAWKCAAAAAVSFAVVPLVDAGGDFGKEPRRYRSYWNLGKDWVLVGPPVLAAGVVLVPAQREAAVALCQSGGRNEP